MDESRQDEAVDRAARLLRHRDHTRAAIAEKLDARGVEPREAEEALDVLTRAGIVDDERYAGNRARTLAERGYGDLVVLEHLEREGVARDLAVAAVDRLPPERERAEDAYTARGGGLRALRALAARGFTEGSLEPLVARHDGAALG